MDREIIMEALKKHEDVIMQFTLGDIVDEYDERYCDVYKYEWEDHSETIVNAIEVIIHSSMPLKPDMIVGIIVNEWFNCVGSDVEELNYYGLLGVAIEIIDYIEECLSKDDNK